MEIPQKSISSESLSENSFPSSNQQKNIEGSLVIPQGETKLISLNIEKVNPIINDFASLKLNVAETVNAVKLQSSHIIRSSQNKIISSSQTRDPSQPTKATNFRIIPLNIDGDQVYISALARPGSYTLKNPPETDEVKMLNELKWPKKCIWRKLILDELKSRDINVLISLSNEGIDHPVYGIKALWENTKGTNEDQFYEHYLFNVEDYGGGPSSEDMNNIIGVIRSAAKSHKNVAMHCGEGFGRTGVTLATIALLIKIQDEEKNPDSSYWKTRPEPNHRLMAGEWVGEGELKEFVSKEALVSPFVAAAISEIRSHDPKMSSETGGPLVTKGHSVEDTEQVEELANLETFLWAKFTKNFNTRQSIE